MQVKIDTPIRSLFLPSYSSFAPACIKYYIYIFFSVFRFGYYICLFFIFCHEARKDERFVVSSYVNEIAALDFLMMRTARINIQIEPDLPLSAQKPTPAPNNRQSNSTNIYIPNASPAWFSNYNNVPSTENLHFLSVSCL